MMRDHREQTASEWMDQQIAELQREAPDLIRWVQTGIRPQRRTRTASQKAQPKDER